MTVGTYTDDKLRDLNDFELDRLNLACDAVIAHYRKTLFNPVAYRKALALRYQITIEFRRRNA